MHKVRTDSVPPSLSAEVTVKKSVVLSAKEPRRTRIANMPSLGKQVALWTQLIVHELTSQGWIRRLVTTLQRPECERDLALRGKDGG